MPDTAHPQNSTEALESDGDDSGEDEHGTPFWRKRKLSTPSVAEEVDGVATTRNHVSQAILALLTPNAIAKLSSSKVSTPKLPGRHRVKNAAETAVDIAHEVLEVAPEFLEFVPIPGLALGARLLLMMWDACSKVDMNRTASLRLTQRCADILLSVHEEIQEAGGGVAAELDQPLQRLVEAFTQVNNFLLKQTRRPFLKRYLKRDEIFSQVQDCDRVLSDVVSVFGLSIQIRMLKQAQAAEAARQRDTNRILEAMLAGQRQPPLPLPSLGESGNALRLTGVPEASSHASMGGVGPYASTEATPSAINLIDDFKQAQIRNLSPPASTSELPPEDAPIEFPQAPNYDPFGEAWATDFPLPPHASPGPIHYTIPLAEEEEAKASPQTKLRSLQSKQNLTDAQIDSAHLRTRMQEALGKGGDMDMIECLQVKRDEMPEAIKALQRALEHLSDEDSEEVLGSRPALQRRTTTGSRARDALRQADTSRESRSSTDSFQNVDVIEEGSESKRNSGRPKGDSLDREFMESSIDALRRMSANTGVGVALPSWTITKYEIDRQSQIGMGFFSNVYQGTFRGQKVAIKVLTPTTPRTLFIKEVSIWKKLKHPNVLELIGASSATSDPPWFLVSPFLKNGSLVDYLRQFRDSLPDCTLYNMMLQVARGMDYLHSQGILHGDLKASNVLVDDRRRCVISDFGQSELKSEAYRLSGAKPPHGTLRWQAPELLTGSNRITTEMDVYAFGVCCVEILSYGRLPWLNLDDSIVRDNVLAGRRPDIPSNNAQLVSLIKRCWSPDRFTRPRFSRIVDELRRICLLSDPSSVEEPSMPMPTPDLKLPHRPSPDMRPTQLVEDDSQMESPGPSEDLPQSSTSVSHRPKRHRAITLLQPHAEDPSGEPSISGPNMIDSVVMTRAGGDGQLSLIIDTTTTSTTNSTTEDESDSRPIRRHLQIDLTGYESPAPATQIIADAKNERRYRILLQHDYHESLTLPLWTPVPVSLGAVGYLSKPRGAFVTLFNAFEPDKSPGGKAKHLSSLYGYATDNKVERGHHKQEKRSTARAVKEAVLGFLRGNTIRSYYSYPLRAGHKAAYLCAETTLYQYIVNLDTPKNWFKANIDAILELYGAEHRIAREEIYLVIGTLDAPDHAQFVSHKHPNGQAHFNAYQSPRVGQPWGYFTTDTGQGPEAVGPTYGEVSTQHPKSASNVSSAGNTGPWDTVLIAKLRFKPDAAEPTSQR